MAKKWTNTNLPGALHFVTGNVNRRKKIFFKESACHIFFEELNKLRTACKIIAFVLMPEHFHLVVNPLDGDIQSWTGALKSLAAKRITKLFPDGYFRIGDENRVWQESFKALPLWSDWMIWQKINYIHANPLKAGLEKRTGQYRWSSFRAFYNLTDDPFLKVDKEWWWPDDMKKLNATMQVWQDEAEENWLKERGQKPPFLT